jgi:hypothetical protein
MKADTGELFAPLQYNAQMYTPQRQVATSMYSRLNSNR